MTWEKNYDILLDFPAGKVNPPALDAELAASSLAAKFSHVGVSGSARAPVAGDSVRTVWSSELDAGEQATLDGLIAAHDHLIIIADYLASAKLFDGSRVVTTGASWTEVDGVLTNPLSHLFGLDNAAEAFGRVTCEVKASGAGAELKLSELRPNGGDPVDVTADVAIPDTAGAWLDVFFDTLIPPREPLAGTIGNEYVLCGRRNGATSLEVRYASLVLLRVRLL